MRAPHHAHPIILDYKNVTIFGEIHVIYQNRRCVNKWTYLAKCRAAKKFRGAAPFFIFREGIGTAQKTNDIFYPMGVKRPGREDDH